MVKISPYPPFAAFTGSATRTRGIPVIKISVKVEPVSEQHKRIHIRSTNFEADITFQLPIREYHPRGIESVWHPQPTAASIGSLTDLRGTYSVHQVRGKRLPRRILYFY